MKLRHMVGMLKQQFNIISALIIREMTTRYGRNVGGYLWAIIDPLATVTILSLVFSAALRAPPLGRSFPLFFATGYLAFYIYRSLADQVSSSVTVNRALLSYPSVHPFDAIFARSILQILTLMAVNFVMFYGFTFITTIERVNFGPILHASVIAACLGIGVGMMNVVAFHLSGTYQQLFNIVNRPAFIVSGVFFLPESIPMPFQEFLMWIPLVHFVSLFRTGFYPTYHAPLADIPYVTAIAFSSLVLGFVAVWLYDAKLREAR